MISLFKKFPNCVFSFANLVNVAVDRTGKEFGRLLHKDKTTGQKWRNSNYDLHTGKTLGYTGMTIAFFVSLIIASLPVSGFYIWRGRRKKSIATKGNTSYSTGKKK